VFTFAAIILILAVQTPPQSPSSAGSLVGCASDAQTQPLPGVAVVAKSGRVQRTTTTDTGGCYELKDLPIGSYRVTALLLGFDSMTRDAVTIAPASIERLDFAMRISPICECVHVGGSTLAEHWDYGYAVVYVRLSPSEPQPRTQVGYYRHAATVLKVLKKPVHPLPSPVPVIQNQQRGMSLPYDIGQELVVFLQSPRPWYAKQSEFVIQSDNPGLAVSGDPAIVFLVQDGHIQKAPPDSSRYVGMPLNAFFNELRALSRNK
jgi:hypothetical protein